MRRSKNDTQTGTRVDATVGPKAKLSNSSSPNPDRPKRLNLPVADLDDAKEMAQATLTAIRRANWDRRSYMLQKVCCKKLSGTALPVPLQPVWEHRTPSRLLWSHSVSSGCRAAIN